ncbi:MAG: JAB domain-containing protein [Pseudomonas sp.]
MNIQLTLIETPHIEAERIAQENRVIGEALTILDRRLFTRGPELTAPDAVVDYLKLHLAQQEHEVFVVVFLDAKHRVLQFEELFYGSIDGASVYPRQVVKRALAHNAAAVILVHFVARHKMAIMCPVFLCVRRRRHRRRSRITAQHQGT